MVRSALAAGTVVVLAVLAGAAALSQSPPYTHEQWEEFQEGIRAFELRAYEKAVRMWEPLAEAGIPQAQYNLGVIYTNGNGVRRDYVEAYKWFAIALAAGNIDAAGTLVTISARMTKDQIAEAERRATEWQALHPRAL
ncbi:MAG: tetratricopeptide repeat protein [Alphaproteobacteria bacterium]